MSEYVGDTYIDYAKISRSIFKSKPIPGNTINKGTLDALIESSYNYVQLAMEIYEKHPDPGKWLAELQLLYFKRLLDSDKKSPVRKKEDEELINTIRRVYFGPALIAINKTGRSSRYRINK